MFFLFAVLSMIGYNLQGVFLVKYARKIEGLSLAAYRNMTLALSLGPLLFLGKEVVFPSGEILGLLLASAVLGALSLACRFRAQKSLPVGIDSAFSGLGVFLLVLYSYFFFDEVLSPLQILFIVFLLGAVFFLTIQDHHLPHLDGKTRHGIFFSLLNHLFGSGALFLLGILSRRTDPLVIAYFWEVVIGISALVLIGIRWALKGKGLQRISKKEFFQIGVASSCTLLGTGALAAAVSMGPIAIVSIIGSTGIAVSTLLCHFIYQEKLRVRQWGIIGAIVLGTIGLRLISG